MSRADGMLNEERRREILQMLGRDGRVLVKELQSLGLAVEVLNEEEEEVTFGEDVDGGDVRSLDINISGFERGEIE